MKEYYKTSGNDSAELKNNILKEFITKYESQAMNQIVVENGKILVRVPTADGEILIKEEEITDKALITKIKKMQEINKKEEKLVVEYNELTTLQQPKRNFDLLSLQLKLLEGKRSLTKQ